MLTMSRGLTHARRTDPPFSEVLKRLALGTDHQLSNMAGALWRRGRQCVDDCRADMRERPRATSDHNARAGFARRAGQIRATEIVTGVMPRGVNRGGIGDRQRCIGDSGRER
jgi:hypothetical protein